MRRKRRTGTRMTKKREDGDMGVRYLIMAENGVYAMVVDILYDKSEALAKCMEYNVQYRGLSVETNGYRFYVVNEDGQTWEYANGHIYRVYYNPDTSEIEFKEVAI